MFNTLFTSKDPKKRALNDLRLLITDLETFWPEDDNAPEQEFIAHCQRVVDGDRTIFNFQRLTVAIDQMGARMVKPVFSIHDPLVIGISQAASLSLGQLANDIRPEITHKQLIDQTKRTVQSRITDIKSEPSIYLMYYALAKRSRCHRFLSKSPDLRHLCQSIYKILTNHYDTSDVNHAFFSAEALIKAHAENVSPLNMRMPSSIRLAYAVLPILQFLQKASPELQDRWSTLKTNVRPLLSRLKRFEKDEEDMLTPYANSSFSSGLVLNT